LDEAQEKIHSQAFQGKMIQRKAPWIPQRLPHTVVKLSHVGSSTFFINHLTPKAPKHQTAFLGSIAILGSSLRMGISFFFL